MMLYFRTILVTILSLLGFNALADKVNLPIRNSVQETSKSDGPGSNGGIGKK